MPPESFALAVEEAGLLHRALAVVPTDVIEIRDLLGEMLRREVELRFMPDLWPLSDAVIASTLEFSNIRMKNASPRRIRPLAVRN